MKKSYFIGIVALLLNIQAILAQTTDIVQLPKVRALGIAPLKRIDFIEEDNGKTYIDKLGYTYDEGRVISAKYISSSNYFDVYKISENPLVIDVERDSNGSKYNAHHYHDFRREGNILQFSDTWANDEVEGTDTYKMTFDDKNQLIEFEFFDKHYIVWGKIKYTWTDGNIVAIDSRYEEPERYYDGIEPGSYYEEYTNYITYSEKENSGLFCPNWLYDDYQELYYMGLFGAPTKNLPIKEISIGFDGYGSLNEEIRFSYEFDTLGRVYRTTRTDDYMDKYNEHETFVYIYDDSPSDLQNIKEARKNRNEVIKTSQGIVKRAGDNVHIYDYSGRQIK